MYKLNKKSFIKKDNFAIEHCEYWFEVWRQKHWISFRMLQTITLLGTLFKSFISITIRMEYIFYKRVFEKVQKNIWSKIWNVKIVTDLNISEHCFHDSMTWSLKSDRSYLSVHSIVPEILQKNITLVVTLQQRHLLYHG